jgi:hypothetical protein
VYLGYGQRGERSERELHPEVLDQEGPLIGGFFDDFAGGFAGAACNAAAFMVSVKARG